MLVRYSLTKAFDNLAGPHQNSITSKTLYELVQELQCYDNIPKFNEENFDLFIKLLTSDRKADDHKPVSEETTISRKQFYCKFFFVFINF